MAKISTEMMEELREDFREECLKLERDDKRRLEESVARDYATGLGHTTIMARNGIAYKSTLTTLLDREHVKDMIAANIQGARDAAAIIYMRESLAAGQVLDVLVERAMCKDDPRQHDIGKWLVDRVAPREKLTKVQVEGQIGSASVEVMEEFSEAVGELGRMFELSQGMPSSQDRVIDIPHLHEGKEFIEKRDKAIAPPKVNNES